MKVQLDTPLKDATGKVNLQYEKERGMYAVQDGKLCCVTPPVMADVTLGAIAFEALKKPGTREADKDKSWKRFILALKVANGGEVDLSAGDITTLMDSIAADTQGYDCIYFGRCKEILDPPTE